MKRVRISIVLTVVILAISFTVTYAAKDELVGTGNSYHLYTGTLKAKDSGVFPVPSRFKWSVETSWRGVDLRGNELPDTRVMLRLYDPDHNFTALTAQMDLETAEKLQLELAEIIAKKRKAPSFQHRPQLYDPSMIPVGRFKSINMNGKAVIELEYKDVSEKK